MKILGSWVKKLNSRVIIYSRTTLTRFIKVVFEEKQKKVAEFLTKSHRSYILQWMLGHRQPVSRVWILQCIYCWLETSIADDWLCARAWFTYRNEHGRGGQNSLDDMGILDKTLWFTVDNAGNNGAILKQLQDGPDVKLSPYMHFRCFAHVLNLAVQNTMESMKDSLPPLEIPLMLLDTRLAKYTSWKITTRQKRWKRPECSN